MNSAGDSKLGAFGNLGTWGLAWAIVRLCLGLIILWWMFAYGFHDDSSLGEGWLVMALAVSPVLVLPATVTLLRAVIISTRPKSTP
jgi:hypothetical protein